MYFCFCNIILCLSISKQKMWDNNLEKLEMHKEEVVQI